MANSVGALTVKLGLDASEYTRGLTRAERSVQDFARNTRAAILEVGKVLGSLAIGTAFVQATKDIIAEASALNDLSDATGSSVEALSRLNNQAKIAGTDFKELETAVLRLSAGMAGTDAQSTKAKEALKALGITTKDPVEALQQMAVKLNTYADGVNKTGLAQAAFGRNGARYAALLKDIAELQDVNATVTKKQADEAEALAKSFNRLSAEATIFRNAILSDVVPSVLRMIEDMKEGIRIAGGFFSAIALFGTLSPFDRPAEGIAKLRAEIEGMQKNVGTFKDPFNELPADIERALKKIEFLKVKLGQEVKDLLFEPANLNDPRQRPKPPAPFIAVGDNGKTAKRILDGQLKDLENFIKAERDTLNDRERFLQGYYNDDLLGVREFFSGRRAAIEDAVKNELAALDKQAALLRAAATKGKPEDRIEAETKLADVLSRRARLEQDTVTKGIELFLDEGRAVKKLQDSVEQASIALAAMRGDSVTAAAASFDFANRQILAQINLLKQSSLPEDQRLGQIGEKAFADTRALVVLREQLNTATQKYSLTLDELGIAQSRVDVEEQANSRTAISAINEKARLAAVYVEQLKRELAAVEAIAIKGGRREDIVSAQQLRAQLDQLAVGYSLVAREARALQAVQEQVFDIGANALADFINGTVSARDALKSLVADLQRFLTNQALMGIKNSIFGGPSTGTDIFSLLAKQFTGGDSGGGKALVDQGVAALTGSATTLTAAGTELTLAGAELALAGLESTAAATLQGTTATAMTTAAAALSSAATLQVTAATAMTTAAAALSAAAIAMGAANSAEAIEGIVTSIGMAQGEGLANGTNFARGGPTLVGERGPEIVDLPAGARVTPNSQISKRMGGITITQHINVMPGATTASVRQAAAQLRDVTLGAIRDR